MTYPFKALLQDLRAEKIPWPFSFRFSHLNTDDITSLEHRGRKGGGGYAEGSSSKDYKLYLWATDRSSILGKKKDKNKQTNKKSNHNLLLHRFLLCRRIHTEISGAVLIKIAEILKCHSRNKLPASKPSLCKHPTWVIFTSFSWGH